MSHKFHNLHHFFEHYDQHYIVRTTLLLLCAIPNVVPTHAMSPREMAAPSDSTQTFERLPNNGHTHQKEKEKSDDDEKKVLRDQLLSLQSSYNEVLLPMIQQYMQDIDKHREICEKQKTLNQKLEKKNKVQRKQIAALSATDEILPELTHGTTTQNTNTSDDQHMNQAMLTSTTDCFKTVDALRKKYLNQQDLTPVDTPEQASQPDVKTKRLRQLHLAQAKHDQLLEFLFKHVCNLQLCIYLYNNQLSFYQKLAVIHKAQANVIRRLYAGKARQKIEDVSPAPDSECVIIDEPRDHDQREQDSEKQTKRKPTTSPQVTPRRSTRPKKPKKIYDEP